MKNFEIKIEKDGSKFFLSISENGKNYHSLGFSSLNNMEKSAEKILEFVREKRDLSDELHLILGSMDLPSLRITPDFSIENLRWLKRNILIRNSNHPDINKALNLIDIKIKEAI